MQGTNKGSKLSATIRKSFKGSGTIKTIKNVERPVKRPVSFAQAMVILLEIKGFSI